MAVFQPMIKYLESHYNSEFYGYMNGDIVMSSQIYDVLTTLLEMRDNHTISDQVFTVTDSSIDRYTSQERDSLFNCMNTRSSEAL